MSLVSSRELLTTAVRTGTAVPAFNVITLEHAEAVLEGAHAAGTPVILHISQNAVKVHAGRLLPRARHEGRTRCRGCRRSTRGGARSRP